MNLVQVKMALKRFMKDESGISAVEYGLLAAGIVVGLWAIISPIGVSLQDVFTSVKNDLATAAPAAGG